MKKVIHYGISKLIWYAIVSDGFVCYLPTRSTQLCTY